MSRHLRLRIRGAFCLGRYGRANMIAMPCPAVPLCSSPKGTRLAHIAVICKIFSIDHSCAPPIPHYHNIFQQDMVLYKLRSNSHQKKKNTTASYFPGVFDSNTTVATNRSVAARTSFSATSQQSSQYFRAPTSWPYTGILL